MDWTGRRVTALLENALKEDCSTQDATSQACIDPAQRASATIISKQDCVLSGLGCIPRILEIYAQLDGKVTSHSDEQHISLYPQPATTRLNISGLTTGALARYEVYNMLGERVLNGTTTGPLLFLSIADLVPGCYSFRLINSTETITRQFIKE